MGNFSDFAQHMDWAGLIDLLLSVAAILLCLTVHETCHGLAACALGDPTAKRLHRLSLNPLRHIDPFGALLNVGLGLFNLIPFPPLDGSKVLGAFLPDRAYYQLMRYERWGMLLLMVLLWLGVFSAPLSAVRTWVLDLLLQGAAWPYYLLT